MRFPMCEDRALRSFFFLQFVQPALIDPVRYQLLDQRTCNPSVQRACAQLGRRMNLVSFANGQNLSRPQQSERQTYAAVINSNQGHITHFLDAISTFPGDAMDEHAALAALAENPPSQPDVDSAVSDLGPLVAKSTEVRPLASCSESCCDLRADRV
jgi:hypothetical protein